MGIYWDKIEIVDNKIVLQSMGCGCCGDYKSEASSVVSLEDLSYLEANLSNQLKIIHDAVNSGRFN